MESNTTPLWKRLYDEQHKGTIDRIVYKNLAAEKFHVLAEALENLHRVVMLSNDRVIFDNGDNAEIVAQAKEALKAIS